MNMAILWKWVPVKSKVLIDNMAMLYDKGRINRFGAHYSTKRCV